jgi:predicted Rossmann-fold nucleotide-binding protein
MDEFFESLTLIQTERIERFPVILVGSEYWKGLISWIREEMLEKGRIEKKDLGIFYIADTPEEVLKNIKVFYSNLT